jgi:hypothetical protein
VSLFDRDDLADRGFAGFITFAQLRSASSTRVSDSPGVYAVLRESDDLPVFLDENPGGRFNGRDPTVPVARLVDKWVQGCHVLYLGKADRLRRRLRQFADFGAGKPVGHWGGRYIWQIDGAHDFTVAWREGNQLETARRVEMNLLREFSDCFGRLPFANLRP